MPRPRISVPSTSIVHLFGWIVILLAFAHFATQTVKYRLGYAGLYGLVGLFDMGVEANMPTFFSGFQLIVCALLLTAIACVHCRDRNRYKVHWAVLAGLFYYLAADELSGLHELTIRPIRELFPDLATGLFYWAWVIPGMVFVAAFGVVFARFVLHALPRLVRTRMIVGGLLFVAGAIGVEMPEARHAQRHGTENMTYGLYVLVEEFLEMTGVLVFLSGVLEYLRTSIGPTVVEVRRGG
ncbi:MAG: hypothetical protein AB7G13_36325 [Lautropia sp.]